MLLMACHCFGQREPGLTSARFTAPGLNAPSNRLARWTWRSRPSCWAKPTSVTFKTITAIFSSVSVVSTSTGSSRGMGMPAATIRAVASVSTSCVDQNGREPVT